METVVTPQLKTYILLPHTDSSARVYVQPNPNQKIRLTKRPIDHAYSQVTFRDRDGVTKTIRLMIGSGCNEIFQDIQIEKYKIPANAKFTQADRDAVKFVEGVLQTEDPVVQKFLETSPQFEDFWLKEKDPEKKGRVGACADIRQPLYKLHDESVILEEEDRFFVKQLTAANKVNKITDVRVAQALMYRLNGSFFKAPNDIKKCRAELIRFLNAADEAMLDELLKEDVNVDEETTILIGKAIGLDIISFDKVPNQIVMIRGSEFIPLKEISSEYSPEQRKMYFAEFLTSKEGTPMLNDIKKKVAAAEKELESGEAKK